MTDTVNVPCEPTREMWAAGGTAACKTQHQHHDAIVESVWSAMLAAAPKAEPVDPEWFGVAGAINEVEALAVALFVLRCPGIRMTDEDMHYYLAAAESALSAVSAELDDPEAPKVEQERSFYGHVITYHYGKKPVFVPAGEVVSVSESSTVTAVYDRPWNPAPSSDEPTKNLVWAVTHMREVLSRLQYSANEKDFEEARLSGVSIGDKAIAQHKGPQS